METWWGALIFLSFAYGLPFAIMWKFFLGPLQREHDKRRREHESYMARRFGDGWRERLR